MIISFKKQRKINPTKVSLTGSILSNKADIQVEFESSLERDYIYLLEFDTNVKLYVEQPISIKYTQENKEHIYTPDFFVELHNGMQQIIEIKYRSDILSNAGKYKHKFDVAKQFCEKNGLTFAILTESDIRTSLLFNAKFLLPYTNPLLRVNRGDIRLILDLLQKKLRMSVSDIANHLTTDFYRKAELIHTIWYVVANNFVDYDKCRKLTMDTILHMKICKL